MPARRSYLRLSGTAITAGLAGCLGSFDQTSPRTETDPNTATPTHTYAEPPAGPVRCRGDPVSVEQQLTDEPGYEDNVEYFPSNRTVRIAVARNAEGPVSFETMPFEEWMSIEATEVGLDRVRTETADRLGTDEFGSGMGRPPENASVDGMVVWVHVSYRERDGETITPELPLARLADVAPRSAEVTVSMKGDAFSRQVPVFARSGEISWQ